MEELKLKTSWQDVTIGEFQEIVKTARMTEQLDMNDPNIRIDYHVNLLTILSNKDANFFYDLSRPEFNELTDKLSFLRKNPETSGVKGTYEVCGVKYNISKTIEKLSKATIRELKAIQYIDLLYINGQKQEYKHGELLHRELAILMIPEGKEYGEKGFDIEETQEHIKNNLNICDALSVSDFFLTLFRILTTIINTSLEKNLKHQIKKVKDPEKKKHLLRQMKNLENFRYQTNSRNGGAGFII